MTLLQQTRDLRRRINEGSQIGPHVRLNADLLEFLGRIENELLERPAEREALNKMVIDARGWDKAAEAMDQAYGIPTPMPKPCPERNCSLRNGHSGDHMLRDPERVGTLAIMAASIWATQKEITYRDCAYQARQILEEVEKSTK